MAAKTLMIMGTGSDVGKSLIVAGLCRAFTLRGLKVMPFKPQNMSNNAAVTADGGEIGRAQALQARAAKVAPTTAMNPVLLKPEHETGAQVIVRGKRVGSMPAAEYFATRAKFLAPVVEAFEEVCTDADLVLVEGAGSASEINLRSNDIANFGFAQAVQAPVIVLGDIQRGGVIASLVGTFEVIDPQDAQLIVATMINRFQGDTSLFEQGMLQIEKMTKRPCFGPIPFFERASQLPAEDILGLVDEKATGGDDEILIAVPRLPRISNFDDLDPIKLHPNVRIKIVAPGAPIPVDAKLIVLPGSKSTRADLVFLQRQGWDIDIKSHARRGGKVLGICGGFQMLGNSIADPEGIESAPGVSEGLGLLAVESVLSSNKQLRTENAKDTRFNCALHGYHMHMGVTDGADRAKPFSTQNGESEGAISAAGNVMGTYLHGLFSADDFRNAFLADLGVVQGVPLNYETIIEDVLDELAEHLEKNLDLDALLALAKMPKISDVNL